MSRAGHAKQPLTRSAQRAAHSTNSRTFPNCRMMWFGSRSVTSWKFFTDASVTRPWKFRQYALSCAHASQWGARGVRAGVRAGARAHARTQPHYPGLKGWATVNAASASLCGSMAAARAVHARAPCAHLLVPARRLVVHDHQVRRVEAPVPLDPACNVAAWWVGWGKASPQQASQQSGQAVNWRGEGTLGRPQRRATQVPLPSHSPLTYPTSSRWLPTASRCPPWRQSRGGPQSFCVARACQARCTGT